jgi:AAA15 family ATPase/GTPase
MIKNCLSFREETVVTFEVNNKAPATHKYSNSAIEGERLSKVICIVGANASGKTNLLRVIRFLKMFLLDSFAQKESVPLPIMPFALIDKDMDPSEIQVEFESEKSIYKYHLKFKKNIVLSESLDVLVTNEVKERNRFKNLFARKYDSVTEEYDLKSSPDFKLSDGIMEITRKRKNCSLISAAIFSNHEPSLLLKKYWRTVIPKIKQFDNSNRLPLEAHVFNSTNYYQKHSDIKAKAVEIMAKCDLGLVGIDIEKIVLPKEITNTEEAQEMFVPYGIHSGIGGKNYKLAFNMQSSGTHRIFVLLETLLKVLKNGGLAVIDELEADLHPELLPALIDLFISPKTNPLGAQLIFTCHATPLLNVLDKYQILIVGKDDQGQSEAWRLDDIEGVRNTDNFYSNYMAGTYGGVPRPGKISDVKQYAQ